MTITRGSGFFVLFFLLLILSPLLANAQAQITTIADSDWFAPLLGGNTVFMTGFPLDLVGTNAQLQTGVAAGAAGNVYVTFAAEHMVLRLAPNGRVGIFAGTGQSTQSYPTGPAASVPLNDPPCGGRGCSRSGSSLSATRQGRCQAASGRP